MPRTYAVYWRTAPLQLFSYKQAVTAHSPRQARELFRRSVRRPPLVIGVKGLASCGRRCSHRGRWLA